MLFMPSHQSQSRVFFLCCFVIASNLLLQPHFLTDKAGSLILEVVLSLKVWRAGLSRVCPCGETHTLHHVQSNPSWSTALLLDLFTLAASGATMRPARPHRWAPAVETIMTLSTGPIKCQQQRDTGRCRPESLWEQREIGHRVPLRVAQRSLAGRVFPLSAVVLHNHHGWKVVFTLSH